MSSTDPIVIRRAKANRLAKLGKRIGYSLWGVAIVAYIIGSIDRFTAPITSLITGCLIAGSVFLVPAIIVSYGVRAAAREDREVAQAKTAAAAANNKTRTSKADPDQAAR
jgi:hypothetical protein